MQAPRYADVKVGDRLPSLALPAIDRTTLALYCGASGDHNPIHIDIDFARKARMPDVFAHGMLSAAYLGRLLTGWVPQQQIRNVSVRFTGITHLGNQPTCTGEVAEKFEADGEQRVRLRLKCSNQYGEDKLVGEAIVALK
ncbi:bifunctional enoyl-CoA hydratase/phosphate acetyltransferase [Caballeronia choica]|uniref:Bifunctional enoyl-CoA hydratase/phosphate acetyltransferase n=1 Tax=Caballeronia choica TaxID=326476 RepID=A0A158F5Q9_9BURK|nr:MaoC family dehydratase [Caballeronia choica]SAL15035.1 bifunctional enoyl-CoA hydratase/phosphate acetyltransferase [Caballeronia choica]